jgi:hypothetical protein
MQHEHGGVRMTAAIAPGKPVTTDHQKMTMEVFRRVTPRQQQAIWDLLAEIVDEPDRDERECLAQALAVLTR